jgi:hypothetical protein
MLDRAVHLSVLLRIPAYMLFHRDSEGAYKIPGYPRSVEVSVPDGNPANLGDRVQSAPPDDIHAKKRRCRNMRRAALHFLGWIKLQDTPHIPFMTGPQGVAHASPSPSSVYSGIWIAE